MQSPGEKFLIQAVVEFVKSANQQGLTSYLINLGAGQSLVLENSFIAAGIDYLIDRLDVIDCRVQHPAVRNCFTSSVESMPQLQNQTYDLALANYVLEHVAGLDLAAKEISRILKPDGLFVASVPNPQSPEFILSRLTPLWFHQLVKGRGEGSCAHETHYAYKSIKDLVTAFAAAGFQLVKAQHVCFTNGYLHRFSILNQLSRAYDKLINFLKIKKFQGNVGLVFKKK